MSTPPRSKTTAETRGEVGEAIARSLSDRPGCLASRRPIRLHLVVAGSLLARPERPEAIRPDVEQEREEHEDPVQEGHAVRGGEAVDQGGPGQDQPADAEEQLGSEQAVPVGLIVVPADEQDEPRDDDSEQPGDAAHATPSLTAVRQASGASPVFASLTRAAGVEKAYPHPERGLRCVLSLAEAG